MTYITQLRWRSQIILALVTFVLIALHSSTVQAQWVTNGTNINNTNTGNVGVGTASPTNAKLHVRSSPSGSSEYTFGGYPELTLESGGVTDIHMLSANTGGGRIWFASPSSNLAGGIMYTHSANVGNGFMDFITGGNNVRMTILGNGNVGIGTASPTSKLHIVGDLTVTGNIAAKYQDVAEWVPTTQALPAATVVTLDPTKSNHVEASSKAYDTRVAGVISAQPGITLGEQAENKVLVATTGRVRVKVDATHAPIRIGDLLVTSDTPGVAMKSEPLTIGGRQIHSPGTLIGKALEPLSKGRGEILVLLSLQ